MFLVYKCTNIINNKIYIGCTTRTLSRRFNEHVKESENNNSRYRRRYFYNAIRKYGRENFKIELLEELSSFDEMLIAEAKWITYYNSINGNVGYNSTTGGKQARMTDEVKKKISETMKVVKPFGGKKHSEENKRAARERRLGQKHPEEVKKKIGDAQKGERHWTYGIPRPESTREKIRKANSGKKASDDARAKMSKARRGKVKHTKNKNSASKYFGLAKHYSGKWSVRVTQPAGGRKFIGLFVDEIDAAKAYDMYVKEHNLNAPLNF